MRALKTVFAVTVLLFLIAAAADTQQKQISDSEYMAQALSAAPEAVAKGAAVVRMEKNESMRTLRKGDNGFTCMIDGKGKGMCNDTVAMEFIDAWIKHMPPPDKAGLSADVVSETLPVLLKTREDIDRAAGNVALLLQRAC